jgi:carboxyl-terminal processing protease
LYRTSGGRTVIGGGGVLPDYLVYGDTLSPLMQHVVGRRLHSLYVRHILDENGEQLRDDWLDNRADFVADYEISDELMKGFEAFAAEDKLVFTTDVEEYAQDSTFAAFSYTELAVDREIIKTLIKGQIASRLYDRSMWYPVYRNLDKVLVESLELWMAAEKLAVHELPSK